MTYSPGAFRVNVRADDAPLLAQDATRIAKRLLPWDFLGTAQETSDGTYCVEIACRADPSVEAKLLSAALIQEGFRRSAETMQYTPSDGEPVLASALPEPTVPEFDPEGMTAAVSLAIRDLERAREVFALAHALWNGEFISERMQAATCVKTCSQLIDKLRAKLPGHAE